ncbi:odorant receptor 85b-like isoform X1 [Ostrinia furnacalis]|uniref:odorant receptor 85b-like isoform X1 n=1 Tax=Ostrinia furnacalis TaxID=93504 RepID=UPI0010392D2E|nr:odorant receptor 85b-like isoform X1 [Ostrinia furnacalis]
MDIPTFEELFKQIKLNLWFFGIPFNGRKIELRFYFMVVVVIIMLIGEISFFVSRYAPENFMELTQLASCICVGALSLLKILPIAHKKQKIFELTESLDGLYNTILENPKKKAIIRRQMILVKILMKYLFIVNIALFVIYNISPLIFMTYNYIETNEVEFILPFALGVPFSIESMATWFPVYAYSVFSSFVSVSYFVTVDALYCILTTHICSNLSMVSEELQNVDTSNEDELKELVKNHQYILKLSENLEEIFSLPNLFNVMMSSLEICAVGFNLTMGPVSEIPRSVVFLSSVLLQILMLSVFGEKLIEESTKVGDAAYNSKWYEVDQKTKKTILIIMTRSSKPQQLTAYKFSVISYGSFTKIISTSWSYFTILKTVYKPPE